MPTGQDPGALGKLALLLVCILEIIKSSSGKLGGSEYISCRFVHRASQFSVVRVAGAFQPLLPLSKGIVQVSNQCMRLSALHVT